jgi:protein-S-isoprenylcysteine O-methyltransferase Ste14
MNDIDKTPPTTDVKNASEKDETAIEIGKLLFEWRDYTPIPLIIIMLFVARPNALSTALGLLLIVGGELIRIYSVAFIGSISRTRSDNLGARLVSTGPFAYVRNPLYVGNFFISTGIAVFTAKAWFVALVVLAFGFQYYFIVKYEESLLLARFGAIYDEFRAQVPAWFPRRRIDFQNLERPDTYAPAFKSEKRTLLAIAAIVCVLLYMSID